MRRAETGGRTLISAVLPAHDEEGSLAPVVEEVLAALAALGDVGGEVIVVDDGSRDGTWEEVRRLHRRHPRVRGLRLTRNFGHQAALLAGLAEARGEAVLTLDADGQHPPEQIPEFVRLWREGAVVVQGLRTGSDGEGRLKGWTSRAFYRLLSALAGVDLRPGSADFRLLSRPAVEAVLEAAGPLPFLRGLIPWLGLPTATVPFRARRRRAGRPSYGLGRMLRLGLDGVLSFSIVPLRLAIAAGLLVSILAFAYLVYVLVIRLMTGEAVPGWASTAGLLSLLGGIQLLTLGILGEYLGRLFLVSLQRPRHVVRERLGREEPPP